jgi:hypothetical protein
VSDNQQRASHKVGAIRSHSYESAGDLAFTRAPEFPLIPLHTSTHVTGSNPHTSILPDISTYHSFILTFSPPSSASMLLPTYITSLIPACLRSWIMRVRFHAFTAFELQHTVVLTRLLPDSMKYISIVQCSSSGITSDHQGAHNTSSPPLS